MASATTIYNTFKADIASVITNSSSSGMSSLLSTASKASTLTVAAGCNREGKGSLRLQFYASAENITREIEGLPANGRRLQSTPCSVTDGTSVRPCAYKARQYLQLAHFPQVCQHCNTHCSIVSCLHCIVSLQVLSCTLMQLGENSSHLGVMPSGVSLAKSCSRACSAVCVLTLCVTASVATVNQGRLPCHSDELLV